MVRRITVTSRSSILNKIALATLLASISHFASGQGRGYTLENNHIKAEIGRNGITSLTSKNDPHRANPLSGQPWGTPQMTYRILDGDWLEIFGGAKELKIYSGINFRFRK